MKVSALKERGNHTVLLFGPPKSGKSLLAGKLAEHFKIIWFDLENGAIVLLQLPEPWQDNIEVIQIPDTRTFPVGIETMMKVLRGTACDICELHGKVSCSLCKTKNNPFVRVCLNELALDTIVVVDSATQLTNSVAANIAKDRDLDYKFDFDDWAKMGVQLDFCFSHIQQARYHCIVITHESEVEMEDGKAKLVPTAGTRNFSRNFAKYFSHVVYVEVKNKTHRATSSSTASVNLLTGSRTDVSLETGELTLLRVFKPDMFPEVVEVAAPKTPGTTATGNLASLRERLKAGK